MTVLLPSKNGEEGGFWGALTRLFGAEKPEDHDSHDKTVLQEELVRFVRTGRESTGENNNEI